MNMLASLKSLLFSSTPLTGAAAAGASAIVEGATDFAALLSDADGGAQPATPVADAGAIASPVEGAVEGGVDAPLMTPEAIEAPVVPDTAGYLALRSMPVQPPAEPGLTGVAPVPQQAAGSPVVASSEAHEAPALSDKAEHLASQPGPVPITEEPALPVAVPASAAPSPVATDEGLAVVDARPLPMSPAGADAPVAHADADRIEAPAIAALPLPAATVVPEAEHITDADSEVDTGAADAPRDAEPPIADQIPVSLPAALPPLPQAPIDAPAFSAPSAPAPETRLPVSPSPSSSLPQSPAPSITAVAEEDLTDALVGADGQKDDADQALTSAPAMPSDIAAVVPPVMTPIGAPMPAPVAQPATDAPIALVSVDATGASVPQPAVAPVIAGQVVAVPASPAQAVDGQPMATAIAMDVQPAVLAPAGTDTQPVTKATDDTAIAEDATAIPVDGPAAAAAKPARAEAMSLLQLVRDHMNRRTSVSRDVADAAVPAADRKSEAVAATDPTNATTALPAHRGAEISMPSATAPQAPAAVSATLPTVDLSASLGQQMVDMGVSGQWIDGLARDIAGLSANGAQGRFQISADQLGPVQVDIRQGSDGAAVSLTVASEAAEIALRQDSDRLKLDAGLAAVRISEVKIERAPHVAETQRSDTGGQSNPQSNGQQSASPGQQGAWQGAGQTPGQSMGQSASQGRWQGRENNGFGHKAGGDPAVLNHGDAGDSAGDVRRARYA